MPLTHAPLGDSFLPSPEAAAATCIGAAGIGTWQWNVETGEAVFNEDWASIAGYTLEELAPFSVDTWVRLVHPDDMVKSNRLLERHFSGHTETYACDCRMRHKDGHWVWIRTQGKLLSRTPDGRPGIICGVHIDITSQRHLYDIVSATARAYELAAEASPVAFYEWNTFTDALTWRGRAYAVMGASDNDALPRSSRDFQALVHRDDVESYRDAFRRYFKGDTPQLHGAARLCLPGGRLLPVVYHGVALRDNRGWATRLYGSFTARNWD